MRVVGICGSLQASSSNLDLLQRVAPLLGAGVEYEIFDGVRDLPLFDPDLERDGPTPPPVTALREAIAGADALLIASPEYGHSLPGSLKNAIDWLIGSGELERKVVGVTAAVAHESRGRRGLEALVATLAAVSARVVGGRPTETSQDFEHHLGALVDDLVAAASAPDARFQ